MPKEEGCWLKGRSKRSEYREVLPGLSRMIRMSWLPDGESVLVISGGIRRIDVNTGAVQTLVTEGRGFHSPRCTPDGKKILCEDDSFEERIFRIMSYDIASGQKKEIHSSSQQIIRMDISPDGKWLAFLEPADASLKVMPLEGGQAWLLYKFDLDNGIWSTSVAWSPDGKYVYFNRGSGGQAARRDLRRIPSTGGNPLRFDLAVNGMENLDIHPDGRRITFNSFRVPRREIRVMENFLPKQKDE
jgi:Tol biopolymer transport system component